MKNSESDSEDEIELLEEDDKYDYWELYYSVKQVVFNLFSEKGILNEMEYYDFFNYIRNVCNGDRDWVNKGYPRKECEKWWYDRHNIEVNEINNCIENYLKMKINSKNLKDMCYTYSSSKYF